MPLYTKRISSLEVHAENLFDKEGNLVESVQGGSEVVVVMGDKKFMFKLQKGVASLGEESHVELTVTEKSSYAKDKQLFTVKV